MIRRDFVKKVAVAVVGLTGMDFLAKKLIGSQVDKEVIKQFAVLVKQRDYLLNPISTMMNVERSVQLMMDQGEHRIGYNKTHVFVPKKAKFVEICDLYNSSDEDEWLRFVFDVTGIEIKKPCAELKVKDCGTYWTGEN